MAVAVTAFCCATSYAQFSGPVIASHISSDSGRPRENYMEYSEKLAAVLNGLTPAARYRVFGDYVPAYAPPVSLTDKLGMEPINFGSLSTALSPAAEAELDKVLEYLLENPNARINIEGHTDANKSIDQPLSEARARAAMLYLAQQGIDPSRIETVGYAGTQPIAEGSSDAAKAQNRRIEIGLLN